MRHLLPAGAVLTVAVDDTLFKRRGKKVFGAAWQHDGAATGPTPVGRGTCFVVIGLVIELPFLARPVYLPVMARLWRPKQELSKVDIAASMLRLLAACHWDRRIHVVADAAYHGKALRNLPATCTFTTRLPAGAVLHDLAPLRTQLMRRTFGTQQGSVVFRGFGWRTSIKSATCAMLRFRVAVRW
ncbi:transposase [Actinacidiphila oryziradicis]|uniref:Transposase n=1 Tax=Actinacidiphila oryziradicis TaxID=2571141 RepID=A0A4U0RCU8_9ACTN|nr:transposase [Actinacidiphila oryziradicis]